MTVPEDPAADRMASRLTALIGELGSVVVAFSGGVDSAVVLAAAVRVLGQRSLAAIADSPSLARRDLADARATAAALGVRLVELPTAEFRIDGYRRNAGDRCYYCKSTVLSAIRKVAEEAGIGPVATGTHLDDVRAGDRPGLQAARELGVVEPLVQVGADKAVVRSLARRWGLAVAAKPATPCLASRIQTGIPVNVRLLGAVEAAEEAVRGYLVSSGIRFVDLRVRILPGSFRIELDAVARAGIERRADQHEGLLRMVSDLGLGPRGSLSTYRPGSANVAAARVRVP
jgi:pyridinium-3,5-biscarboxylic acid mononucleotide sulfurtransferase